MKNGALFLGMSVTAVILVACGAGDPGAKLYADLGCPGCHGKNGEGNRYGPALENLGEHYASDAELVRYLKDPKAAVEGSERLQRQAKDFKLRMLPVKDASDSQLEVLAAWLRTYDSEDAV
jgi:hypothetical protein